MAVSGLQRLTVAAVVVLCAALILPRVLLRRDSTEEPAPGRFPPMMHRHVTPDLRGQRSAGVRGHGEVRGTGSGGAGTGSGGAGTGSGPGGKSNLAAQIIPVYGFGILLYILYILFKITSKGHSKPSQSRLHSLRSENNKRKITDFELSQLQERLRETELVMENLVNTTLQEEDTPVSVSMDQEQSLLQQLTEITRAMKTNHLVQDFTTNTNNTAEETDSVEDCDPFWSHCSCNCQTQEEEITVEDQTLFYTAAATAEEVNLQQELLTSEKQETQFKESLGDGTDFSQGEEPTATEEPEKYSQTNIKTTGGGEVHREKQHTVSEDLTEDQENTKEQPETLQELQPQTGERLYPEETYQTTVKEQETMEGPEVYLEKQEQTGQERQQIEVKNQNTALGAKETQLSEDCPSEATVLEEEHLYGDTFSREIQTKTNEGSHEEHQASSDEDTTLGGENNIFHQEKTEQSTSVQQQNCGEAFQNVRPKEEIQREEQHMVEEHLQTSEEMFPQTSEEKVHPRKREAPSGMRRRNRRRRGRRL